MTGRIPARPRARTSGWRGAALVCLIVWALAAWVRDVPDLPPVTVFGGGFAAGVVTAYALSSAALRLSRRYGVRASRRRVR
ncbi:hypothetical protein [Spongiactinospora sp. TRM90649]|uniref:hypothetical protein n=1 Tax=Spongiactinospora sp. TRM90649 TaxID=3031114 RepID=UPI0023F8E26D|nr:hypothetical protein [Spongiactinospora sp. TRM90649]MDF5758638.1 hypothetical protein [Spongiactinospora sp. TRM90649]